MFTGARIKTRRNGLAAGCQLFYRKIYDYFLQCTESAIEPQRSSSKLMIQIALLENLSSLKFIKITEFSHTPRHSRKPNKLRNVNPGKVEWRTPPSKKGNFTTLLIIDSIKHQTMLNTVIPAIFLIKLEIINILSPDTNMRYSLVLWGATKP